jgi:hypothetical protein
MESVAENQRIIFMPTYGYSAKEKINTGHYL